MQFNILTWNIWVKASDSPVRYSADLAEMRASKLMSLSHIVMSHLGLVFKLFVTPP